MCGIVGLLVKKPSLRHQLGALMVPMLTGMTERGPDSAGLAVYTTPVSEGLRKLSLYSGEHAVDWSELLARIEVLARRHAGRGEDTHYRVGDLELDRLSHRVVRGKEEIPLQPREFRLLEYLMKHAGQVVTRTMLLENVWDYHFDPQTNVIDVHISRLRSKIDKGFAQPLLHTVRGAGYMIRDGAR